MALPELPSSVPEPRAVFALQVPLDVAPDAVIFDQGVVHIGQKDDPALWRHEAAPRRALSTICRASRTIASRWAWSLKLSA